MSGCEVSGVVQLQRIVVSVELNTGPDADVALFAEQIGTDLFPLVHHS
jgi:hypothetical protein